MSEKKYKILIIDDNPAWWVRPTTKLKERFEFDEVATDGKKALMKINNANNEKTKYDAIILDRVFGGSIDEGKIIFQKIKEVDSSTPVILCSGTVKSSLNLKDYPGCVFAFEKASLNSGTNEVYENFAEDIISAIKVSHKVHNLSENKFIIGKTEKMKDIYKQTLSLASVDTSVLIRGESGTGKELIASELHYDGKRDSKPFVKLNCAALSESLLESELFGHVKGAFTGAITDKIGRFQMADGGTIFLDEIGDISPNMQLRLLRVLQEGEFEKVGDSKTIKVDVRVIAATNINLEEKVKEGKFREDLYYRLKVAEINLPSLRDRKIDIPELSKFCIEKFNEKLGKNVLKVRDDALKILTDYNWPGNIREFENAVERAMVIARGGNVLLPDHFDFLGKQLITNSASKSDELINAKLTLYNNVVDQVFENKYLNNIGEYKDHVKKQDRVNVGVMIWERYRLEKGTYPNDAREEIYTLFTDKRNKGIIDDSGVRQILPLKKINKKVASINRIEDLFKPENLQ